MARSFSAGLLKALLSERMGEVYVLLTLTHANLDIPIRLVLTELKAPAVKVTSNGNDFTPANFDIVFPGDSDEMPRGTLRVSNVDRKIGKTLKTIIDPIIVRIDFVLPATPDVLEMPIPNFELRNVQWNQQVVEGDLTVEGVAGTPWPRDRVDATLAPALFKT